jgi:nitroreductase/FMN reductase [NAD(P)H]
VNSRSQAAAPTDQSEAAARAAKTLEQILEARFGAAIPVDPKLPGLDELTRIAGHRVHRRFLERAVEPGLLRLLCACALSAPSKSDLQQADILIVGERATQRAIAALITDMPWIADAPAFLVFLANGRRLPQIAAARGKPFPNDHLDLFFNAAVDSAIVLTTFLRAAAAVGLGCCPISAIRDHAATVSEMLALPERVIPVAGLCVGWPRDAGGITSRLGLEVTLHHDRYAADDVMPRIDDYDRRREARRPYARQREPERWGMAAAYGWSEDKARQYAEPLRADFGAFVRAKGFRLD